jgi:tRNA-specific 2-thiouridylase
MESQNACFLENKKSHYDFILERIGDKEASSMNLKGYIVSKDGTLFKEVFPYFRYTIGQRRGLGIRARGPYYVLDIKMPEKKIIIGKEKDLYSSSFFVKDPIWYDEYSFPFYAYVKIRYTHKEEKAILSYKDKKLFVSFLKKQKAITRGQLAVFYNDDMVIGSGWID